MKIWYWTWDQHLSKNMGGKFGNMGSMSIKKHEMTIWHWIGDRYLRESMKCTFCISNWMNLKFENYVYFQFEETIERCSFFGSRWLNIWIVFSIKGIPHPSTFRLPPLHQPRLGGHEWSDYKDHITYRELTGFVVLSKQRCCDIFLHLLKYF